MQVVTTREQVRTARADLGSVGFVPTMGYLHEGHLELVRAAKAANDAVAVSIFVNPTQFAPGEDFETYPRDTERDLALLEAEGVDLVWVPEVEDVYPEGSATSVQVGGPALMLEGTSRPTHFSGVATVVSILFNVVRPQRAYFGQKDAQQCAVVRRFTQDLALGVDIGVVPTHREADGLAMSSRNVRLDEAQRAAAPVLRRALVAVEDAWAAGTSDPQTLRDLVTGIVGDEPLGELDYVSVAHPDSLAELTSDPSASGALVSMAVRFGSVRLIDNTVLASRP